MTSLSRPLTTCHKSFHRLHLRLQTMPKSKSSKGGGAAKPSPQIPSNVWTESGTVFLNIHAKPGAKQSCITEISDTYIAVQVAAPAQEGEANAELVRAIASMLGVRKSAVTVDKGRRSRDKRIRVSDLDKDTCEILSLLQACIGKNV